VVRLALRRGGENLLPT